MYISNPGSPDRSLKPAAGPLGYFTRKEVLTKKLQKALELEKLRSKAYDTMMDLNPSLLPDSSLTGRMPTRTMPVWLFK